MHCSIWAVQNISPKIWQSFCGSQWHSQYGIWTMGFTTRNKNTVLSTLGASRAKRRIQHVMRLRRISHLRREYTTRKKKCSLSSFLSQKRESYMRSFESMYMNRCIINSPWPRNDLLPCGAEYVIGLTLPMHANTPYIRAKRVMKI